MSLPCAYFRGHVRGVWWSGVTMPRKKTGAKRRNRDRMRRDGVSYYEARRRETAEARRHRPSFASLLGRPRSVDELLAEAAAGWASRQLGEPATDGVWGDLHLPAVLDVVLDDPSIREVSISPDSVWSDVAESYEDGTTVATTAYATATVQVDGLLPNADAEALAEGGLVTVLDRDWNDHYTQVVVNESVAVEVEFNAIVDPEFETVHDLEALSAELLAGGQG